MTPRRRWSLRQLVTSLLVVLLGMSGVLALRQADRDLRLLYTEYTLAAMGLAHITTDLSRYRNTVLRALEAPTQRDYDHIVGSLPDQRARVLRAVDGYAFARLRVSRSSPSEAQALEGVRSGLRAYFSAADETLLQLHELWKEPSPARRAALRAQADRHIRQVAGARLLKAVAELDRLLDAVADVGRDMRDEGERMLRMTSLGLLLGSLLIAMINLLGPRKRVARNTAPSGMPADRPLEWRERELQIKGPSDLR